MANFSTTFTAGINFFGIQPSTKFGSPAKFGTDVFGNGGNTNFDMPTVSRTFNDDAGPTFSDSESALIFTGSPFVDMVTFVQNPISEELFDGTKNWNYVFPPGVINDEQAVVASYTKEIDAAAAWTIQTTSSNTWSTG